MGVGRTLIRSTNRAFERGFRANYREIDLLLRIAVALPAVPIPTIHYLRSNLSNAPAVAINDIGSAADFMAAIEGTIKNFNDGDLVEGIIVQVDRDEVLVDIGYKTEGVIPSRELSIKHDIDPNEIVSVGDRIEALVLQKKTKRVV